MADREDCEDEGNEEDICPTQKDVEELKRKLKAPDRAKFEREFDKINTRIRQQEAKFRSLQSSRSQEMTSSSREGKDRETLMTDLRGVKAERDKEINLRKKIDQELKGVNSLVQQKNDACGKVQAGLKYKTEARADEAIRRLEHQMRVQQLKLREEKRLVSEIDALKRSKKQIQEFDSLKQEIGHLRDKQNALRKERDNCMRTIARLKSREEEIKSSLDEQRTKDVEAKQQQRGYQSERNALKKEIDDLYTKKRSIIATYNKEKEEYQALLKDIKEQERHIKREVEAMKRIEQRHSHRQQHGNDSEEVLVRDAVHQKMLNICDSLIKYLGSLNVNTKTNDTNTSHQQDIDIKDSSICGGIILKRKMDDDLQEMYAGSKKNSKRGSRKGRKSAQKENTPKKLVLHPLVLDEFLSVNVTPPSTATDVPRVLELLIEKKENLSTAIDFPDLIPRSPSPSSSSSVSSLENFPSLPSQKDLTTLDDKKVKDDNSAAESNSKNDVETATSQAQPQANQSDVDDKIGNKVVESCVEGQESHEENNHTEQRVNCENEEQDSALNGNIENPVGASNSVQEKSNIFEDTKDRSICHKDNEGSNSFQGRIDKEMQSKQNESEGHANDIELSNQNCKESSFNEEEIPVYDTDIHVSNTVVKSENPSENGLQDDRCRVLIAKDKLSSNAESQASIKCPS